MCATIVLTIAVAITIAITPTAAAAEIDPVYRHSQERADAHYQDGEYRKAYRRYMHLAKVGDTFAQYRLSLMNLYGQGMGKDPVDAYAWAALSAQSRHPDVATYRDLIWNTLDDDQREEAREKTEKLAGKYSNVALAEKARDKARRRLSSCTGSRLSTRCEDVYITSAPAFGGGGAGNGFDGEGQDVVGAHQSYTTEQPFFGTGASDVSGGGGSHAPAGMTDTGSTERDIRYWRELRETVAELDRYIAEHEGVVTLGEFELVEEDDTAGR